MKDSNLTVFEGVKDVNDDLDDLDNVQEFTIEGLLKLYTILMNWNPTM